MNRTMLLWFACGLGLMGSASLAPSLAASAAGAPVTFRAQVVDQSGHPVKAALVSARSDATDLTTVAITDDRGTFQVPHLVVRAERSPTDGTSLKTASATVN